jgi:transposase
VRERQGDELDAGMTAWSHSGIEALARCAQGLQEDLAAAKAGPNLPWSNGLVKGRITPLTWLKRQGDGRTGFPLLRRRVLQAA